MLKTGDKRVNTFQRKQLTRSYSKLKHRGTMTCRLKFETVHDEETSLQSAMFT